MAVEIAVSLLSKQSLRFVVTQPFFVLATSDNVSLMSIY
jgi:hypothetical protein